MSQYIVSARKYRPESFGTLIGQDNIAKTLSNSIKRGQLAHAYLFCGPRGVGKTTTARIFAKMINCEHPGEDMEPCGHCESCESFREGRSYCIHEMDAASNNSVEDIKALLDQVQVPPPVGKYSVYIIDEVHMLSQSAFNAFLKTLEEPPAHAIFILATTEKHKVLPTILSRCQTYDFSRISVPDIVRNLRSVAQKEEVKIDDESLHVIAVKADGAMRDALTIFDQTVAFCGTDVKYEDVIRNLNVLDYEYSFKMVDYFLQGDYASALLSFNDILAKGFNPLHFIGEVSNHLRNLIVSCTGGLDALLELPDSLKKRYAEQAARCSLKFLYDALGITIQCESQYKASSNPRLHIEFALMRLSFLVKQIPGTGPGMTGTAGPGMTGVAPSKTAAPASAAPAAQAKAVEAVAAPAAPAPAIPPVAPAPAREEAPAPAPVTTPAPAAPAPAPETPAPETPAPAAPAPRRRRAAKTGASLSLNAIMDEKEEAPEEVAPAAAEQPVPEDDAIRNAFTVIAENYASKVRLYNMLKTPNLVFAEADGNKQVTMMVVSVAQKKYIEEQLLRELEGGLRKTLSTSRLILLVDVLPDSEVDKQKKPYMPGEQARDLIAKNENVRSLVEQFKLDTK